MPLTLSLVLPCYNEELNIARTVHEAADWMQSAQVQGELIVVDDGSKDASLSILRQLEKEVPLLRIVARERNGGYGVAVRSGCDAATMEWIAFVDSDGQFAIRDLELLMAHTHDYAFITGRRLKRADSFVRNMFGKMLGVLNIMVLHIWIRDVNCGMKMFRKDIWPKIRPEHGVEKFFNTEMFLNLKQHGIPYYQLPVPHYPRKAGNPTGSSLRVIIGMIKELWNLRMARKG